MKSVAVLLVNYNGMDDTVACVESLRRSTTPVKIVIVDNCSKNNEADQLAERCPEAHIIKSETNLGFAGGNNLGLRYLAGQDVDYIMLLNNDTVIAEDMIDTLIGADNGHCICAPKMYYYDFPDTVWYGGGTVNRLTGDVKHLQSNCTDGDREDQAPERCTFATFACVLMRKEALDAVGYLDEDYFMYCEDADYCLRALSKSMDILYVPKAHMWHKVGKASGGEGSPLSRYYGTRNSLLFIKKNRRYFAATAFPYAVVKKSVRAIQLAVMGKKQGKAMYQGIKDYFHGVRGRAKDIP